MRQQKRRLVLALVLAPVAAAGLAAAPADARGPARHTVPIEAALHDPGAVGMSNPGLDCSPEREGVCAVLFKGVVSWTGDWEGTSTYRAKGYARRPGQPMVWEVWETFTGTVAGCGTGKFSWYGTGTVDFERPDTKTRTFPMTGTLRLVGPGEGDLRGITGSLPVSAHLRLAPFPFEQRGTVLGEVTCHQRG